MGAADVDDSAGAKGRPGVVAQEVGDICADFGSQLTSSFERDCVCEADSRMEIRPLRF